MKPQTYRQTPPGIMSVLELFQKYRLHYVLFKCEHIFAGQNKNLDILFETDRDYRRAALLLEEHGFIVRLSERIEKYKTMYCGFVDTNGHNTFHSIHLHREIAWHGMKALDKRPVFQRAHHLHPLIVVPRLEDSILIHAAHVLFENLVVRERERTYFLKLPDPNIDKEYILWQLRKNGWLRGFQKVIHNDTISKTEAGGLWMQKLWKEPAAAAYLFQKALRIPLRKISFLRSGCLIALVGVNGSGKSTIAKTVLEQYRPITAHVGKKQQYYYFGWEPTFFITKMVSHIFRRKNKRLFSDVNFGDRSPGAFLRFDLFQELLFIYLFFEFYYRYLSHLRPKLQQGSVMVSDRYFYDVYGQYNYAPKSIVLPFLLRRFPRPDFSYLLAADPETLLSRGKIDRQAENITEISRQFFPPEYIQQQCTRYDLLSRLLPIRILSTAKTPAHCARQIVAETWKGLVSAR